MAGRPVYFDSVPPALPGHLATMADGPLLRLVYRWEVPPAWKDAW
jgi:hypothetical protein